MKDNRKPETIIRELRRDLARERSRRIAAELEVSRLQEICTRRGDAARKATESVAAWEHRFDTLVAAIAEDVRVRVVAKRP